MDQKVKQLAECRLQKAKRNLEVVESLIRDGYYNFAINRSYYAVFDAMRAVNALEGFDSNKHSGVIAHFNQFYVKTGVPSCRQSRACPEAHRLLSCLPLRRADRTR